MKIPFKMKKGRPGTHSHPLELLKNFKGKHETSYRPGSGQWRIAGENPSLPDVWRSEGVAGFMWSPF